MFDEAPISRCSQKEPIITLSSCEAEYIIVLLCTYQVVRLMNLLEELSGEEGYAVTFMVDNVSTLNLAKTLIAYGRSKHIEMRFHYLREFFSEGKLRLRYCISEDQVVNLLTK